MEGQNSSYLSVSAAPLGGVLGLSLNKNNVGKHIPDTIIASCINTAGRSEDLDANNEGMTYPIATPTGLTQEAMVVAIVLWFSMV
jgi:hypothetical protein